MKKRISVPIAAALLAGLLLASCGVPVGTAPSTGSTRLRDDLRRAVISFIHISEHLDIEWQQRRMMTILVFLCILICKLLCL